MPARMEKNELLSRFIKAIELSGWDIAPLGNSNAHPLKVKITSGSTEENLLIYIWNISHGGKTRSVDEFRIQITGVKELAFEEGFKTLLLGRAEVDGMEVLNKHKARLSALRMRRRGLLRRA